jgi:hypothetical protein
MKTSLKVLFMTVVAGCLCTSGTLCWAAKAKQNNTKSSQSTKRHYSISAEFKVTTEPASPKLSKATKKTKKTVTLKKAQTPAIPEDAYTSLIIDARDLGIERAMSPKILRTDGYEVWGTVKVDPDYVNDSGIVSYAQSIEKALACSRCGNNPLVVKATGKGSGPFGCDVVVSEQDAKLILDENARGKFLNRFNVIFLIDPSN